MDFRETLGELLAENHYGQLADSLQQRGMGLYSESHESGRAFIGDGMQVSATRPYRWVPCGRSSRAWKSSSSATRRCGASRPLWRISTVRTWSPRILHDRRRSVGLVAGDFETHGRQEMAWA